jgi:predicted enzyme related to lactoylglutathione lyase
MKSAISWFDIPTQDFERAVKFYSDILGQPLHIQDYHGMTLAFFPMDKEGEVGGDLMPPTEGNRPSGNGTRIYLNCDGKLDEVISRVPTAGGQIVENKFHMDEVGFIAFIKDSEGNIIGLHSTK